MWRRRAACWRSRKKYSTTAPTTAAPRSAAALSAGRSTRIASARVLGSARGRFRVRPLEGARGRRVDARVTVVPADPIALARDQHRVDGTGACGTLSRLGLGDDAVTHFEVHA